jgi:hypothetical protein
MGYSNTETFQPANNDDIGVLEKFVSGLNKHDFQPVLDLFNDSASLTEINEVYLGTTVPDKGADFTCNGKAEIESWLEYQTAATIHIEPLEYKFTTDMVILEALFYYPDQIQTIQVDAQTQDGRINAFYFFIEQIKYVPSA